MTLLFDASPIAVYPALAASLGSLQEAIVLQQLHNQLCDSATFKNGAVWVCRSIASWQRDVCPWIKSEKTLRHYLQDLRDLGLVKTANYNLDPRDHTLWYTIDYDRVMELKLPLFEGA